MRQADVDFAVCRKLETDSQQMQIRQQIIWQ